MWRSTFLFLVSLVYLASAHEKAGGKLKVSIKPPEAVSAGAQWQLDSDSVWRSSGASASNLAAGNHAVTFKKVSAWKAPKAQTVTIVNGQTTTLRKKYKPKSAFTEETILLPGDVPLVMVWVPADAFYMGRYTDELGSYATEDPQHQVTISQGSWIGKYEITKAQWEAVMGTTPWAGQTYTITDPNSAAVYISWDDIQAFITALNLHTGQTFRLPTEAQWEYACRAGTSTRFYWGDDLTYAAIGNYAWWYDNAGVNSNGRFAHIVGQKLPNQFGLYDTSGNAWEMCQDWYGAYVAGSATDPTGPETGTTRVVRGGGWNSNNFCRSAYRNYTYQDTTGYETGFRIAR